MVLVDRSTQPTTKETKQAHMKLKKILNKLQPEGKTNCSPMTTAITAPSNPMAPYPTPRQANALFILCGILFCVFVNNGYNYDCKLFN